MSYTVVWMSAAEEQLAEIWINAADKAALTLVVNQIDAIIDRDPYEFSESREADRRVMNLPPLGVSFRVSEDDRLVRVIGIWIVTRRS
jgi:SpoVK/Ycf46/Vps4 family AAA+-type ATPase